MKTIKRILAAILAATLMIFAFAGCGEKKDADKKDTYKIGIALMVENGAFTDMKEGIISRLNEKGYTDENTEIDYQCASGDATALSTIVSNMNDGSYDLIFTVATPPTQAFVNLESDTPCFFCAVSAPVEANILSSLETPDKNATGTSNAIPVSDIFELAKNTTPDVKKYGLIYSGNEDNATNTIEQCKKYLDQKNIEYTVKTAPASSDVETATNALISDGADAIFVPNDSIIQAGVESLAQICKDKKIPTYCSSATTVASGCFATLAIDDKGIGEKTADMAIKYLEGTPLEDIPSVVVGIDYCSVNKEAMDALGFTEDDIKTEYDINVIG
ncbi:MAG: ABC transporter substrate-binding protein [Acutalibacteraceae bacterium]